MLDARTSEGLTTVEILQKSINRSQSVYRDILEYLVRNGFYGTRQEVAFEGSLRANSILVTTDLLINFSGPEVIPRALWGTTGRRTKDVGEFHWD